MQGETESRFPSGPWTGYFLDARQPGRHRMDLDLSFTRGRITGDGDDRVGVFSIHGRYSEDGECRWSKEYSSHVVLYRGFREGRGIWGTWEMSEAGVPVRGGFQIWPRALGESFGEEAEEHAPQVLVGGSV